MKCPLLMIAFNDAVPQDTERLWSCLKNGCAWWDDAFDSCAVLSLEADLKAISTFLDEIAQKMPHAGQFLK